MNRSKLLIALPLALGLIVGSALLVQAADGDAGDFACADIISGAAEYAPPTVSQVPGFAATPGNLKFTQEMAAASCPDVQYGFVVLADDPSGGTPTVLSTQVLPGDGVSNSLSFDLPIAADPTPEAVCIYSYTVGSTGDATVTTPDTGNPHGQTASGSSTGLVDRAPDGTGSSPYCVPVTADGGPGREYN